MELMVGKIAMRLLAVPRLDAISDFGQALA